MALGADFKTDDMALVATLSYFGHTAQRVEWEDGTVCWYFMRTEDLVSKVEGFLSRKLAVEPRQFNFTFGEIKKSFYKLKDANQPVRRY